MLKTDSARRSSRLFWAGLVLFLALAVAHTWPLASAPGTLSRNDTADTVLHEWTLAWLAHQIVRDPLHLFEANIFYPDRLTLAYSDHLLVPGIATVPLIWAGASPVLAYNLLLIAGLALSGWAVSLVVHRWTGSWLAGLLAGSAAAFNAITLTRLPQVQDQHVEFFALALLALDRLLAAPGVRHALQVAGWFVLQGLTGGYWLAFTSVAMMVGAVVRPGDWTGSKLRTVVPSVVLAGGVAVVALAPFLLPYWIVSREQGLVRTLDEVKLYSAHLEAYLSTAGRLHFSWWSHRFFTGDALFPGVVAFGLAVAAVGTGVAFRDRRARMALAFGVVAFALSFGPAFPPYELAYSAFPLLTGLRGAARFGHVFLIAVAILAGFGLAAVQQRFRRAALSLSVVLLLGVHAEALRAPMGYTAYEGIAPIWDEVDRTGDSVLAMFPFYPPNAVYANVRYMLASTRFWRPMLNGYSGFTPPSYLRHAEALRPFPNRSSIDYLREVGVTHVVVQGHLMSESRLAALDTFPELRLFLTDGSLRVYALDPLTP